MLILKVSNKELMRNDLKTSYELLKQKKLYDYIYDCCSM